jgi:hypothetical protein
MITDAGKDALLKYLAGQIPQIGGALVFGVGTTLPTGADTKLEYEVYRSPVTSINADLTNSRLVFKCSLLPAVMGTIYEIGLYTSNRKAPYTAIPISGIWTNGSLVSTNARINGQTVKVDFTASTLTNAEQSGFMQDFSTYTDADSVVVAFQASTNVASVSIRIGTDSSNYYQYTFATPSAGYHIYRVSRASASVVGSPSWGTVSYIAVRPTGTSGGGGSVWFDSVRLESNQLDNTNIFVAREVLVTPTPVDQFLVTDTEYSLSVTIT